MKDFTYGICIVLICVTARAAFGHGSPIVVGQSGGTLTVSGGLPDSAGFAPQVFVEDDEDGDSRPPATLPNVGPVIFWQIPGYDISGLNDSASLSIEVLARPVKESNPIEERILWYWNPLTQEVEPAESEYYLLGTSQRFATLSPEEATAPPAFLMAATLAGQQGFHNHNLLSYALDNDPSPADGAYGIFARMTSSQYLPSDPFLIVVNSDVDYEHMVTAALAINAAAADPDSLPGDFNVDGTVDAADYVVWRKSITTAPEYDAWSENFGATSGAGQNDVSGSSSSTVPEPLALQLLIGIGLSIATGLRTRKPRRFPRMLRKQIASCLQSSGSIDATSANL
jgi:hypothetical protein